MLQVSLKDAVTGAELSLKPGVNRVGRADDNDLQVPAPSVSSHHCEITVGDGYIRIQDLGSTNGTYLEGTQIQQGTLAPGQTLRLGDITFQVSAQANGETAPAIAVPRAVRIAPQEVEAPKEPTRVQIRPALSVAGSSSSPSGPIQLSPEQTAAVLGVPVNEDDCPQHPGSVATLVCNKCSKKQCTRCARANKVGMKMLMFCSCGGQCRDVAEQRASGVAAASRAAQSTYPSALKYPFKRDGWLLLVGGTILYLIIDLLQMMPVGWIRYFAMIFGYGYLFGYMQQIVSATAHGEDEPPGWPDFSDYFQDIVQPFLLLAGTVVALMAPAIAAFIGGYFLLGILLAVLSAVLFPMALLGVLMSDSFSSLNPLFLIASIVKTTGSYLFACFVLGLLLLCSIGIEIALNTITIPLLPAIITGFFSFYFITVYMRVLGLFYRRNAERLAWL
jgi:hypothetical protein